MLIIPAIDLRNGKVVRLAKGKFNQKIYSLDPLKVALSWQRQGAKLIHVVDLDGAITGKPKNLKIIEKIAKSVSVPIQCGGGIRDEKIIKRLLKSGIRRVVLGTRAIEDLDFLRKIIKIFKAKIAVSIDEQKGIIAISGWRKKSSIGKKTLLKKLKEAGLKTLIYTDISRDGTLTGPNINGIKETLTLAKIPLIASGGISNLEDIKRIKKIEKRGVIGIIIGKALYENKFSLKEAIEIGK